MDPIDLVGPAKAVANYATLEMRITNSVVKAASQLDVEVGRKKLRLFLYETKFAERIRTVNGRRELKVALKDFLNGDERGAAVLFPLLEQAFTARGSAVDASMAGSASIHERLDSMEGTLTGGDEDAALWPSRLAQLMPLRAQTAELARQQWSRMPTLLGLLLTGDQKAQLVSWGARRPKFLDDAPAVVFCWLSDISNDFGLSAQAISFLDEALERGPVPLGYWEGRRLWIASNLPGAVGRDDFGEPNHPLIVLLLSEQEGDHVRAVEALTNWKPASTEEAVSRSLLLAQVAFNGRNYDRVLELTRPLLSETGSPRVALLVARALIARGIFSTTAIHDDDAAEALEVLLKSRDNQRIWGYDPSEHIVLATIAARILNDPVRALSLTFPPPDGEATESEAGDIRVRTAAATMLAENGHLDMARRLLGEESPDPLATSRLNGLIALAENDEQTAITHLSEAARLTDDPEEKGRLAQELAYLGVLDPFVQEQRDLGNESFADTLTLIADAFSGRHGGEERLKAAAHSSGILTLMLSRLYDKQNNHERALRSLSSAAARLRDPDLYLSVAIRHQRSGRHSAAIKSVEEALAHSRPAWGGFNQANGVLAESFGHLGDWDSATRAAEKVVRALPSDAVAAWSLATCQVNAGELDSALGTWASLLKRQRPATHQSTITWLKLYQEYGDAVGTLDDLVSLASTWAEDEAIRSAIVGFVILPTGASGTEEAEAENDESEGEETPAAEEQLKRAKLVDEYLRDYPKGAIRAFQMDTSEDADVIAQLTAAVESYGARPDTTELDNAVFSGQFPVGMLNIAHGSTYAEAVISHAAGVRRTTADFGQDLQLVVDALDENVVADTSALFLLSVLSEEQRTLLMAPFGDITIASGQYRDAIRASSSIKRFHHAGPNLARLTGRVSRRPRPADSLRLDLPRAKQLVQLMSKLNRESPRQEPEERLGEVAGDDAWGAALLLASSGRALWCDDIGLSILATHFGMRTFSTPMLVAALQSKGQLSGDQAAAMRVCLLAERYVSFPFERSLYESALHASPEGAYAVAAALENLDGHAGQEVMEFFLASAPMMLADGNLLELWLSACTRWMTRVSGDSSTLKNNMRLFSSRIVRSSWLIAQTMPYIDAGITDGLDENSELDPFADVIAARHRQLVLVGGPQAGADWLLELISGMEPVRRIRFTRIALS